MKVLNKAVAFFTALFTCISGFFTSVSDKLLYPSYEVTESIAFAQSLGRGWNLGNNLDACEMHSTEKAGLETETMWGNPKAAKELIAFVKECGFDSVRIPVTWAQHLGDAPDYIIDEEWLDRVNEIVDWVLELDMKAIINVHHDDTFWLITDTDHKENAETILTKIWSQVSERFASYDENLAFEVMNEPRVVGAENEWSGNEEMREVVNELNFAALETIRNSSGNNKERFVLIPTYACSGYEDNVAALRLPEDNRVVVSVHFYFGTAHKAELADAENKWNLSEKYELYKKFKNIHKSFVAKGYGVCLSEYGWTDRTNMENLAYNAGVYTDMAEKFGFSCIVWDDGYMFTIIDRNNLTVLYPEYIQAVV